MNNIPQSISTDSGNTVKLSTKDSAEWSIVFWYDAFAHDIILKNESSELIEFKNE